MEKFTHLRTRHLPTCSARGRETPRFRDHMRHNHPAARHLKSPNFRAILTFSLHFNKWECLHRISKRNSKVNSKLLYCHINLSRARAARVAEPTLQNLLFSKKFHKWIEFRTIEQSCPRIFGKKSNTPSKISMKIIQNQKNEKFWSSQHEHLKTTKLHAPRFPRTPCGSTEKKSKLQNLSVHDSVNQVCLNSTS